MKKEQKIKSNKEYFTTFFIEGDWSNFDHDTFVGLVKNADYSMMPDNIIAENEIVYENIEWERVEKYKILRLITRNPKIIDFFDIGKLNFKIKELKYFLLSNSNFVHKLGIDLQKINKKECFELLLLGNDSLWGGLDMDRFSFTPQEQYQILKAYGFNETVFKNIKKENLSDYHIGKILENTGDKYIKELKIEKITAKKWCEILQKVPTLVHYCNISLFESGDIFNVIKLVEIFKGKRFVQVVKNRGDYKEGVSALGWEKLLVSGNGEFDGDCDFFKLNNKNWEYILKHRPELKKHKSETK